MPLVPTLEQLARVSQDSSTRFDSFRVITSAWAIACPPCGAVLGSQDPSVDYLAGSSSGVPVENVDGILFRGVLVSGVGSPSDPSCLPPVSGRARVYARYQSGGFSRACAFCAGDPSFARNPGWSTFCLNFRCPSWSDLARASIGVDSSVRRLSEKQIQLAWIMFWQERFGVLR